jgi:hypothetical protein
MLVSTTPAWGIEPTTSSLGAMSPYHQAKARGAFLYIYIKDVEFLYNKWYVDFWMTCRTYEKLCDILKPYIQHIDINYKETLSMRKDTLKIGI